MSSVATFAVMVPEATDIQIRFEEQVKEKVKGEKPGMTQATSIASISCFNRSPARIECDEERVCQEG
jgi:hypothetical protein